MEKSQKTCMEQAEIIDTFGTYQRASIIAYPAILAEAYICIMISYIFFL